MSGFSLYIYLETLFYKILFFLFQKLKHLQNRYLSFIFVLFFSAFYSPALFSNQHGNQNQEYICQVNHECLDYLHNKLLNKESSESIYQICKDYHKKTENCCANPMSCNETYAENTSQDLNNVSSHLVQQAGSHPLSCHLNNLSTLINALADSQSAVCEVSIENCNFYCENELNHFKKKFRECFFIQYPHTINSVLRQAQRSLGNPECWKEIKEVTDKYKKQSLNQRSLFQEDIKAKDIIDCNSIEKSANRQNLNNLALNVCSQAQIQQETERQQKPQRETKQIQTPKETPSLSPGTASLRFGAGAGITLGIIDPEDIKQDTGTIKPLNSSDERLKKLNQEIKNPSLAESSYKKKNNPQITKKISKSKQPHTPLAQRGNTSQHLQSPTKNHSKTKKANRVTLKNKIPFAMKGADSSHKVDHTKTNPKNLQTTQAGNTNLSGKCETAMPEIESAIVYQSVEAPQIEPQHLIENIEDIYKDYDLVQGKPAAVLVKLNLPEQLEKPYSIGLQVNNKRMNTRCTNHFTKKIEKDRKLRFKESNCQLEEEGIFERLQRIAKRKKGQDIYYFIEIPTQDEISSRSEKQEVSVSIKDQNQNSCSSKNFFVFMKKTDKLHLDFISIEYDNKEENKTCKQNEVSDPNIQEKFANSDEVKKYLPMMYPIREDYFSSKAITHENLKSLKCDNTEHDKIDDVSIGLLFDVFTADIKALSNYLDNWDGVPSQTKEGYYLLNRKLVVIVSRNYMKFHGLEDTNGFFIAPFSIEETGEGSGSWNVAFVVDDTLQNKDAISEDLSQGIVLHELAHALGQAKEYYPTIQKDTKAVLQDDDREWFCKFPGKARDLCHKHRIFGGFQANFNLEAPWMFLNNKVPFMNNAKITLPYMWIDRKTYQKLFKTLHNESLDPSSSRSQGLKKHLSPVVSLAGVYDKQKGKFYEGFSMAYAKGLPTVSQQKGDIEILLTETIKKENHIKSRVLSKARIPTDMKMELILNNGGGKIINLNKTPIVVNLPLPKRYLIDKKARKNLKIRVRETFYRNVIAKNKTIHPYIHQVGFEGAIGNPNLKKSVTRKKKLLYNAPVNWNFKPKDLVIKKR